MQTINHKNPCYMEISFDILDIQDLPVGYKLILALIEHDCRHNGICSRTLKNMAEVLRVVPLTVTKGIRKLKQDGHIEIIEGKSEKNRPQYSYKVTK